MSNHADFKVKHGLVVNTTASFLSNVNSISTATGGVQISGGVGIAKDVYVGGNLTATNLAATGNVITSNIVSPSGTGYITLNTATFVQSAVSVNSTDSGALQIVNGGLGVGGSGYFGGVVTATNFYINGYAVSTASALTIQGYGTSLGTAGTLNFSTGTTATVVNGVATIQATAVGGGGAPNLIIEGQGTVLTTVTTLINFVGGGVSSTVNSNSTTEVTISIAGQGFPTGDYGIGEPYAQNTGTTDAFGVSLLYIYDCMDPSGYYSYADLGQLT